MLSRLEGFLFLLRHDSMKDSMLSQIYEVKTGSKWTRDDYKFKNHIVGYLYAFSGLRLPMERPKSSIRLARPSQCLLC